MKRTAQTELAALVKKHKQILSEAGQLHTARGNSNVWPNVRRFYACFCSTGRAKVVVAVDIEVEAAVAVEVQAVTPRVAAEAVAATYAKLRITKSASASGSTPLACPCCSCRTARSCRDKRVTATKRDVMISARSQDSSDSTSCSVQYSVKKMKIQFSNWR